jgi:hypothetical protein
VAACAKRPDSEPDQIKRAGEFQHGKGLGTCQDERRDAKAARDHMNKTAQRGAERGIDAGFPAF